MSVTTETLASGSALPRKVRLRKYYDETWLDYWWLWVNGYNLAMHFGYRDASTRGHADALVNSNRVLAALAGVRAGSRVLDAGCGVGGSSLWLAGECGASVVGITLVESQVRRARYRAAKRGLLDRVAFLEADFTQTPFPSGSFDVVWALESMLHAPAKVAFYREVARLLRPGGRLVSFEYVRAARPLPDEGERLLREWFDGWVIPDLDTRAEHQEHAMAAGLVDFQLDDVTSHTRASLRRLYRITFLLYPFETILRWLRIRTVTQHGNVISSMRHYQSLVHGCWFYGLLSATKP